MYIYSKTGTFRNAEHSAEGRFYCIYLFGLCNTTHPKPRTNQVKFQYNLVRTSIQSSLVTREKIKW